MAEEDYMEEANELPGVPHHIDANSKKMAATLGIVLFIALILWFGWPVLESALAPQPAKMLIIGNSSTEVIEVLNANPQLARYDIKAAADLMVNPAEKLKDYKIILLDQSEQANKEVSTALADALVDYVKYGGKLITVKDSGIKRPDSIDVLGWEASFQNTVPVKCEAGYSGTPTCLDETAIAGKLYREKDHPILKGIEVVPADPAEGLITFEVLTVKSEGTELAYIKAEGTSTEVHPAIIEKTTGIGKCIYFNYNPGKTRAILENTIKYLK